MKGDYYVYKYKIYININFILFNNMIDNHDHYESAYALHKKTKEIIIIITLIIENESRIE